MLHGGREAVADRPPVPAGAGLGPDLVQTTGIRLDGIGSLLQRLPQRLVECVVVVHVGFFNPRAPAGPPGSSTARSAAIAREVWLFTAPLVIPIVCAICASDRSA